MKLSQYIYGRKPKAGLQVITRSRELPFFVKSWFESPRYGAAPVRSTPDRIWTQRYELQCFEGGVALSCLYPLKQTEVPCSEQQEPYIRGITPAVQHLLAGADDADELIAHIDSALHFDGFHQIDEIYRLPSTFSEPIDFTPAKTAPAALSDRERELCVDLAGYLWQAFMSRKDGKTGELAQRAVRLIVPAGEPAGELENQRRLAAYTLNLLPPYIRRWASVTLNMDVESEAFPNGSALYGMARAHADSQPVGKGIVFDAEKLIWPAPAAEERAYFQARALQQAVVLLDDAVSRLPVRFDLAFHLRLQMLLDSLCRGCCSVEALQTFLKNEKLNDFRDILLPALANAVLFACRENLNRIPLSSLWMLAECSPEAAKPLQTVQCSVDECLAVITRDGVCAPYAGLYAADEVFSQLVLRLSAADRSPVADTTTQNVRLWLSSISEDTSFVEQLVNGLIEYGKLVINNHDALQIWLENNFVCRMKTLSGSHAFMPLLDQIAPQTLSALLLGVTGINQACPWTTGVEKLLIEWFNRTAQLPGWNDEQCLLAARRALALEDKQELWPVFALRCADALGRPSEACTLLLRDPWVRQLPQVQPLVQKFAAYVHAQNVNALCAAIRQPDDVLKLSNLWESITSGEAFQMNPEQWQLLHAPILNALNGLKLKDLFHILAVLRKQSIPQECAAQAEHAIAIQMITVLPQEDLTERTYDELEQIIRYSQTVQENFSAAAKQRLDVLYMLQAIVDDPCQRDPFNAVRRGMSMLAQDNRQMLHALLRMHINDQASSILLQSIRPDNTIDWAHTFARMMNLFGLPDLSPNDIPKGSVEDYEIFLVMLTGLYQTDAAFPFGHLINTADRQSLNSWLPATHPKLHKRLMAEQKKFGDLHPDLVEGLQLAANKR